MRTYFSRARKLIPREEENPFHPNDIDRSIGSSSRSSGPVWKNLFRFQFKVRGARVDLKLIVCVFFSLRIDYLVCRVIETAKKAKRRQVNYIMIDTVLLRIQATTSRSTIYYNITQRQIQRDINKF